MGHKSNIEWTEATWNPWHGCHKVSQGCKNCYMFRDKARYSQDPNVVVRSADKTFYAPLKWSEPRTIFTCSWSDFFIEEADAWRDEAFAIMSLTPQHTYQILTKRPDRMLKYLTYRPLSGALSLPGRVALAMGKLAAGNRPLMEKGDEITRAWSALDFQLPNVWLGVSIEDQKTADERIPLLVQTPAAVRWLSAEPLLGPIDFFYYGGDHGDPLSFSQLRGTDATDPDILGIDWVVAGGESGPDSRPMHPEWARSIRDQCTSAGVPFFFKQWGEWIPIESQADTLNHNGEVSIKQLGTREIHDWNDFDYSLKVGKKKAGRLLDGRTWDQMPEVSR